MQISCCERWSVNMWASPQLLLTTPPGSCCGTVLWLKMQHPPSGGQCTLTHTHCKCVCVCVFIYKSGCCCYINLRFTWRRASVCTRLLSFCVRLFFFVYQYLCSRVFCFLSVSAVWRNTGWIFFFCCGAEVKEQKFMVSFCSLWSSLMCFITITDSPSLNTEAFLQLQGKNLINFRNRRPCLQPD